MFVIRGLLIVLALSGLIYLGTYLLDEGVKSPCAPSTVLGRCYHTTQEVCEVVLANSERTCNSWIKKFTFEPGRLTSPILEKCRQVEVDKALRQSLKSTAECEEYRRDLDGWKRENF